MVAILKVKRMHADAALERSRLPQLGFHVVHTEMLYRTGEKSFKIYAVGHLVHHLGKHTDIRQHDVRRADGGIEDDRIHEIVDVVETAV